MAEKTAQEIDDIVSKAVLAQLAPAIERVVQKALEHTMQEQMDKDVYSVYEPQRYKRRRDHDGLMDSRNIKQTMEVRPGEHAIYLTIKNIALPAGEDDRAALSNMLTPLANIINFGYSDTATQIYAQPRPFMDNMYETLSLGGCAMLKALVLEAVAYGG